MAHGGPRKNSGRKPGSKSRLTKEIAAATPPLDSLIGPGPTPLEILLQFARDEGMPPDLRIDAAKGAAPYCHKRQPQDVNVAADVVVQQKRVILDDAAGH